MSKLIDLGRVTRETRSTFVNCVNKDIGTKNPNRTCKNLVTGVTKPAFYSDESVIPAPWQLL